MVGTLTKIGKPIKFEIECLNEAEAERIHDEIAAGMKEYGWEAPLMIWSEAEDENTFRFTVRVGDWNNDFSN